jgi:hypothetical protein
MCYIDGQKNKYSVLNECNRMLKYNIFFTFVGSERRERFKKRFAKNTLIGTRGT